MGSQHNSSAVPTLTVIWYVVMCARQASGLVNAAQLADVVRRV